MQLSPAQAAALPGLQHLLQLQTAAGYVIAASSLAAAHLRQPLRQRLRLAARGRWQPLLALARRYLQLQMLVPVLVLALHWIMHLALLAELKLLLALQLLLPLPLLVLPLLPPQSLQSLPRVPRVPACAASWTCGCWASWPSWPPSSSTGPAPSDAPPPPWRSPSSTWRAWGCWRRLSTCCWRRSMR